MFCALEESLYDMERVEKYEIIIHRMMFSIDFIVETKKAIYESMIIDLH